MLLAITGPEWIQIVTLVTTCITTLGGIYLAVNQIAIARNVQKIETATNSMKDALVKETRQSATLQGAADERARASVEAGDMARGTLAEKERSASPTTHIALAENMNVVKEDVKIVKDDVKDVQADVKKFAE